MIYKILAVLILVGVIIGLGMKVKSDIYNDGFAAGVASVVNAQTEANEKVKTNKKVMKHETQSLDRPAIVRELCALGFVRDKAPCPAK